MFFTIIKQLKAVPCVNYFTFESLRKSPFKLRGRRRRPLYLYYLLKCVWLQCLKACNIIYSSLLESLKLNIILLLLIAEERMLSYL